MTTQMTGLRTTEQVAGSLQVSVRFICDLVRAGKVTPLRVGTAKNAPMRFGDEHIAQIHRAMTPEPPEQPVRRRRRTRRT